MLRGLVLVGLVLLGASLFRRAAAVVTTTAQVTPQPVRQTERQDVAYAQRRSAQVYHEEAAPESASAVSATDELSRDAEEQYRLAPYVPSAVSAPAPPEPPRASVDPEPLVPDDPRDFELR